MLEQLTGRSDWPANMQRLAILKDSQGRELDRAMAVFHPAPRNYTGEDSVEISTHGNPLIVRKVMEAIQTTGLARLAERGEFTRRAFLNGKLDLAQAEAVQALISARSNAGLEMAENLLDGELSATIRRLAAALETIIADIEASFIVDEDIEFDAPVNEILIELNRMLESSERAASMYEGVTTAIAGLPNAGKSSLLNAVLGYERAIVHEEAGTTRDIIREHVVVGGIDYIFHDTAGIREVGDGPEKIGIDRTFQALAEAQLLLYVVDAAKGLQEHELRWLGSAPEAILVYNKIDLLDDEPAIPGGYRAVKLSAKHKLDLESLFEAMQQVFPDDLPRIFLERHVTLLSEARDCLQNALEAVSDDVLSLDLVAARTALLSVIGEAVNDDVLDRVFATFCVGK